MERKRGHDELFDWKPAPVCIRCWVDVSGWNKMIQLQYYQKDDSVDYTECGRLTVLSKENRVLTQVLKESICSVNDNREY
jgi:hypothetical protein